MAGALIDGVWLGCSGDHTGEGADATEIGATPGLSTGDIGAGVSSVVGRIEAVGAAAAMGMGDGSG